MDIPLTHKKPQKSKGKPEKKSKSPEDKINSANKNSGITQTSDLFSQLFHRSRDIILLHDLDMDNNPGKILMVNNTTKNTLGFTEEELKNKKLSDLIDPPSIPPQQELERPDLQRFERNILTKDGRTINTEVFSHIFQYQQERYAFTVFRDITDKKNIEKSLKKTEERYKRLIDNLSEEYIIYSYDTSGMITYVSPSIKKILGYTQEEASRNYKEFLTDHEMNKTAHVHSELTLKGIIQPPFLNELYHCNGSTRIFSNTELPVFDADGEVIAVEGIAHDITDRLKAEKELKIQEERFRLLVETIEEVFWIYDMKKDQLTYISPRYEKVYGRSCESLYKNPGAFLKVVHPEDREKIKKAYKKIEKGHGIDDEYRLIDQDGNIKWIWSKSFIIHDEKKKPKYSIGMALDVTNRKRDQLEKNLLAAIVENTEDHAVIKDINLRVIASNRANTIAAGRKSMEEMIGKTDLELYGDQAHVRQYIEHDKKALQLKKGETLVSEEHFIYPNNQKIHSLVKKFPIYDENNKLIAVASISRDITDYKNALQDLFESEQKYKMLINNQGEGIGLINPEDKFIFANPKAEELFEVPPGKLVNRTIFDFLKKSAKNLLREKFANLRKGEKCSFELEITSAKKNTIHILCTGTPQFREDKFVGIFIIFRDITDWKKAQEEIKKSESELREANAAKDKFFSIIAHDLKNPFNSILGFCDLLLKDYNAYNREEIFTFIKMINDASRQAHNLLDNLLTWSIAQIGGITFEPHEIDMYTIVKDSYNLFHDNAREKNIELDNQINPGTLVFADQNMINIVLRNLISNAVKFTKPKGKVTISAKTIDKMTEIAIIDTGIGIREKDIPKLFRIDVNFSTPGTANEEGTGLGLILCKEFIKKNCGTISVTSKEGKGTKFIICLPSQAIDK